MHACIHTCIVCHYLTFSSGTREPAPPGAVALRGQNGRAPRPVGIRRHQMCDFGEHATGEPQ